MDLSALKKAVEQGSIDTVLVVFPDMQGRLMGKRATAHAFVDHAEDGFHACNYLLATDMEMELVPGYEAASWAKGYGDFVLRPDVNTLRRVDWLEGTALVFADLTDNNDQLLPHAPRTVLQKQVKRLEQLGFTAHMASELELYLFQESFTEARAKRYHGLIPTGAYIQDYHILQTTKEEGLIRAIRNHLDASGVPMEGSKGEWGPGQEELNLVYTTPTEMADRHTLLKHGAKEIAHQQGRALTFMPKWRPDLAGNSCHVHFSLVDRKEKPAFFDAGGPDSMSEIFQWALAGQLALAKEFTFFLAPSINAYKRFQSASFAPTKLVWSHDNRTAGFRVVGKQSSLRVECRVGGGDLNPYLAYAALIASTIHGIENRLPLPEVYRGDAYGQAQLPEVPKTLREAVANLEGSETLRLAFGGEVVDHYVRAGKWEQEVFDRQVTDFELIRQFERG
jgi:glutamine synthetase